MNKDTVEHLLKFPMHTAVRDALIAEAQGTEMVYSPKFDCYVCSHCHGIVGLTTKFCPNCGKEVNNYEDR